jgi:four helix bundle protein
MRDFKKLEVWKKAHDLTLFVYKNVLPKFPKSEQFDLLSQTKRAAYSIPLNIVEGSGRFTEKDFAHFLDMALGSTHELEYSCLLSKDLSYIDEQLYNIINQHINEVKAMLIGLIKVLRK